MATDLRRIIVGSWTLTLTACLLSATAWKATAALPEPASARTNAQIEADWLRQDAVRWNSAILTGKQTKPEDDAPGACDGVKDGKWGFHTALENDPWWQVDLGKPTAIDRELLFNRCDHTAVRIARLGLQIGRAHV